MQLEHAQQLSVVIDHAASGDNEIVAAVAGKQIRVLSILAQSAGIVTMRFESGAGGDALTGQMAQIAQSGFSLTYNSSGWFKTNPGEALSLELSAAVKIAGVLNYDLITQR